MTVNRLAVREASAHMLADVQPLAAERVRLDDAFRRVIAEDVTSSIWLPPRDNASMDGFAVRADDLTGAGAKLRVIETIPAGRLPERIISDGEAARIMTGAFIPEGADSVIRIEDTDCGADVVCVNDLRDARKNIRRRGEDVRAGDVVARTGTQLFAAHIGVLSSVGCAHPLVYRRPRVAIIATGDELVLLDDFEQVASGERIVSSNTYALSAAVTEAGGIPVPLGIAPDNPAQLAEHLKRAEGCDMLLTSGGVSVGDFDYTRDVIAALGGTLSLWRVRMRPGAPIGFGNVMGMPWLGLPGNPVSSLVTFELFGRPMIRTLMGHGRPHRKTVAAILDEDVSLATPLTHFLRVTLTTGDDGVQRARLTGAQSSGMLTSMSAADALLIVPPEPLSVARGTTFRALPLHSDAGNAETFLA